VRLLDKGKESKKKKETEVASYIKFGAIGGGKKPANLEGTRLA